MTSIANNWVITCGSIRTLSGLPKWWRSTIPYRVIAGTGSVLPVKAVEAVPRIAVYVVHNAEMDNAKPARVKIARPVPRTAVNVKPCVEMENVKPIGVKIVRPAPRIAVNVCLCAGMGSVKPAGVKTVRPVPRIAGNVCLCAGMGNAKPARVKIARPVPRTVVYAKANRMLREGGIQVVACRMPIPAEAVRPWVVRQVPVGCGCCYCLL